jgi:DNA-binding NtrC family response regulator
MSEQLSALVVNEDASVLLELRAVLEDQEVVTRCARTCEEARAALSLEKIPTIVFTGTSFPDGNWRDVIKLAEQASPQIGVIVTTRSTDMRLYLDAMDEGAADYIVPPFVPRDVAHIIRSAIQDVRRGCFGARACGAA